VIFTRIRTYNLFCDKTRVPMLYFLILIVQLLKQ